MQKTLWACPKCGNFYSTAERTKSHTCDHCGAALEQAGIPYEQWELMSNNEKDRKRKEYCAKRNIDPQKAKRRPFVPEGKPEGVTAVGCCFWALVVLAFVGGFGALLTSGIFAAGAVAMGCIVMASLLFLVEVIAYDVRQMKNTINQYMYEHQDENNR